MTEELARRFAEYAYNLSYTDLDNETIETTKDRVLDSIATAYAGLDEKPVQNLIRYSKKRKSDTNASIIGGDEDVSVEYSAFINGAMIRYLDWNDTYLDLEPAHPSDNLGAVLSVADAYNCTGEDTILAAVLSYELQCRLCDASSLRKNGWDHVNYGLISATLGAAKLMDLDIDEMTQALNLAINPHAAMRQARAGELSEWKGFAFANVDRNAVFAAGLADEGLNGPAPIFEGEFGFFNQLTGEFSIDIDEFGGNNGDFKINETYIKFHPVEYHAQAAVNIALDLVESRGIDWREIEEIENESYEAAVSIIVEEEEKWRPKTRETADHSMPYCIARSFIDGEMTLAQFEKDKYTDPDVLELMDKISIVENTDYTERYGESFPHRMVVHLEDGESIERELEYPKGHPGNPLSRDELEEKFRVASKNQLGSAEIDEVIERVWSLDDRDASDLFKALV